MQFLYITLSISSLTVESRSTVGRDVQQSLRQDSVSLEALNEYVPLPFGQFAAVFVHQKWQVSKGGRLPSKRTVHEEMFRGGDEPLRPSQHVADPHVMIIHYVSKVIGGKTICFSHYRVPLHLKEDSRGYDRLSLHCLRHLSFSFNSCEVSLWLADKRRTDAPHTTETE